MASTAHELTLIGLCDGELDFKRHQSSFLTNKVGGQPDWLPVISRHFPRCRRCGATLAHVVQVYCPLEGSPFHRNLHLFACLRAECSGQSECWTILRSQSADVEVAAAQTRTRRTPPQEAAPSTTDWCDGADDWGMEGEESGDARGGLEQTSKVLHAEKNPQMSVTDISSQFQVLSLAQLKDIPVFRPFFISVVEESDLRGEDGYLEHAQELLRDYEKREGVAVGQLEESRAGGGEEKYEKTRPKHGDAAFCRFMKTISLCPEQILRYCRGGKPLFISKPPSNMAELVSACSSCGGPRTFELQLMPALVSLLQGKDGGSETELEFGTVLVYTCTNSCWTSGSSLALEEFCYVQTDPDQQLFK
ncbi:programmed cell death protein 2-like [Melanotaenia boesemani]|uniref:programmed cell death protein 2-like n=1 Tax=Melanotaenia boesemani TaxID=1250792 RepID=UPI001C041579|nr:programmed cell death protein 2-like [Melanotaenia boesemani]